ncbi:uncharacterized protein [Hyperolius riggenbachi]|uniref:uncharacterized protein isoform X4 n=1 Tax=Hyperolius riggenbachi TaxID=752182 RepID=UPI0035A263C7
MFKRKKMWQSLYLSPYRVIFQVMLVLAPLLSLYCSLMPSGGHTVALQIELYVKRAEAFLQLGDFQSATLNLQKACSDANPSEEHIKLLAGTYYLQGQSLFQQMRHMEALECFTLPLSCSHKTDITVCAAKNVALKT